MKRTLALLGLVAALFALTTSCKDKFKTSNADGNLSTHVFTLPNVDVSTQIATVHGALGTNMTFTEDLMNNDKVGFEWGTDSKLSGSVNTTYLMQVEQDNREFWANLYILTPATHYYFRAFIIINGKREYGQIFSFTTLPFEATDVVVSPDSYVLQLEDEVTVQLSATVYPEEASDHRVTWTSDNSSIASVSESGLVTANSEGETYIRATSVLTSSVSGKCKIKVQGPPPEGSVDMGLPSKTLWSDRNLGASSSSGNGVYYAWAETSGKFSYTTDNYKWAQENGWDYPSRYNGNGSYGNSGDKKLYLKDYNYQDDAARVVLGGSWRVPSLADFLELRDNCTITAKSGGFSFKAKNPDKKGSYNELFFPFNGRKDGSTLGYEDGDSYYGESQCYFWMDEVTYYQSSGQYYYVYALAYHFYKTSSGEILPETKRIVRCRGLQIRPVCN